MTALHPAVAHVATLLGTWSGTGHGEYPTIEPFDYFESITFGHVGKPFLSYVQRTRSLATERAPAMPMHAESGYWRFPGAGRVEVVLAHPTGVVEIEEGTIELDLHGAILIELVTSTVVSSRTAKRVTALERSFRIAGDLLDYTVRMAAVGIPMQPHLAGTLTREQPD